MDGFDAVMLLIALCGVLVVVNFIVRLLPMIL